MGAVDGIGYVGEGRYQLEAEIAKGAIGIVWRALDTATGEEIGELLLDLNASGQTLILVTHNPDLAAKYAQRVVSIEDGSVASDSGALPPSPPATSDSGSWR